MARPERNNIDYFPHPVKHGKKMSYIEKKYKNDGYAVWMKLLEELGDNDYHYLDLSDEVQVMFLEEKCNVDKELLLSIINDLVKLGEFDSELWEQENILWDEKFINSISDAYRKRSNNIINKESLIKLLTSKGRNIESKRRSNEVKSSSIGAVKPQRIEENRIEEKTIEEIKEDEFNEKDFEFQKFLCEKFGVTEIKQPNKFFEIVRAITYFKNKPHEQNKWFRDQCWFYWIFKEESKEKTHNLNTFLKGEDGEFESGGWNNANWKEKIKPTQSSVQPTKQVGKKIYPGSIKLNRTGLTTLKNMNHGNNKND